MKRITLIIICCLPILVFSQEKKKHENLKFGPSLIFESGNYHEGKPWYGKWVDFYGSSVMEFELTPKGLKKLFELRDELVSKVKNNYDYSLSIDEDSDIEDNVDINNIEKLHKSIKAGKTKIHIFYSCWTTKTSLSVYCSDKKYHLTVSEMK